MKEKRGRLARRVQTTKPRTYQNSSRGKKETRRKETLERRAGEKKAKLGALAAGPGSGTDCVEQQETCSLPAPIASRVGRARGPRHWTGRTEARVLCALHARRAFKQSKCGSERVFQNKATNLVPSDGYFGLQLRFASAGCACEYESRKRLCLCSSHCITLLLRLRLLPSPAQPSSTNDPDAERATRGLRGSLLAARVIGPTLRYDKTATRPN